MPKRKSQNTEKRERQTVLIKRLQREKEGKEGEETNRDRVFEHDPFDRVSGLDGVNDKRFDRRCGGGGARLCLFCEDLWTILFGNDLCDLWVCFVCLFLLLTQRTESPDANHAGALEEDIEEDVDHVEGRKNGEFSDGVAVRSEEMLCCCFLLLFVFVLLSCCLMEMSQPIAFDLTFPLSCLRDEREGKERAKNTDGDLDQPPPSDFSAEHFRSLSSP